MEIIIKYIVGLNSYALQNMNIYDICKLISLFDHYLPDNNNWK